MKKVLSIARRRVSGFWHKETVLDKPRRKAHSHPHHLSKLKQENSDDRFFRRFLCDVQGTSPLTNRTSFVEVRPLRPRNIGTKVVMSQSPGCVAKDMTLSSRTGSLTRVEKSYVRSILSCLASEESESLTSKVSGVAEDLKGIVMHKMRRSYDRVEQGYRLPDMTALDPFFLEAAEDLVKIYGQVKATYANETENKYYKSVEVEMNMHLINMVTETQKAFDIVQFMQGACQRNPSSSAEDLVKMMMKLGDFSATRESSVFGSISELSVDQIADLKRFFAKYKDLFPQGEVQSRRQRDQAYWALVAESGSELAQDVEAISDILETVLGTSFKRTEEDVDVETTARHTVDVIQRMHAYNLERGQMLDLMDKIETLEHWHWFINLMVVIGIMASGTPATLRPVPVAVESKFAQLLDCGLTFHQAVNLVTAKPEGVQSTLLNKRVFELQKAGKSVLRGTVRDLVQDKELQEFCEGLKEPEGAKGKPYMDLVEEARAFPMRYAGYWWQKDGALMTLCPETGAVVPIDCSSPDFPELLRPKITLKEASICYSIGATRGGLSGSDEGAFYSLIIPPKEWTHPFFLATENKANVLKILSAPFRRGICGSTTV